MERKRDGEIQVVMRLMYNKLHEDAFGGGRYFLALHIVSKQRPGRQVRQIPLNWV